MDHSQIQALLNDLVARATNKGLIAPKFEIEFQSHCVPSGNYQWKPDATASLTYEYVFGSEIEDLIRQMQNAIAATPSLEERQRAEYLKRLAATIEYGKSIGLDEDFINPLALQMKKLSSNIIEHNPVQRYNSDVAMSKTLDDDIPF